LPKRGEKLKENILILKGVNKSGENLWKEFREKILAALKESRKKKKSS